MYEIHIPISRKPFMEHKIDCTRGTEDRTPPTLTQKIKLNHRLSISQNSKGIIKDAVCETLINCYIYTNLYGNFRYGARGHFDGYWLDESS